MDGEGTMMDCYIAVFGSCIMGFLFGLFVGWLLWKLGDWRMKKEYFTREVLVDIIKNHGSDTPLMSTNCNGNPIRVGDYVFNYGTAKEVLGKLNKGEKTGFA